MGSYKHLPINESVIVVVVRTSGRVTSPYESYPNPVENPFRSQVTYTVGIVPDVYVATKQSTHADDF